jgi:hypothetical protein
MKVLYKLKTLECEPVFARNYTKGWGEVSQCHTVCPQEIGGLVRGGWGGKNVNK